jgi:hypothetical protein
MTQQETDKILDELDTVLDRVDELILSLPIRAAVKKQLTSRVYELYAEVEGCLELSPVDW